MAPSPTLSTTRSARTPRVAVAVVAAIAALVAGPAAVATAASPAADLAATAAATQWSVTPADANGPDGRVSLRHVVEPGATATDAIAVTNLGAAEATFGVASGDGRLGDGGAFDIAPGDPVDSGAWIRIDGLTDGTVTLAPGEVRVLPVTIAVPADATPGDHPAGIVVGSTSGSDDVSVTNRIGVRLHLQVAGEITPQLDVAGVSATFAPSLIPFAPGTLTVTTEVVNSGNVRLGVAGSVEGFGVDAAAPAEPAEALPGDPVRLTATTSAWPTFLIAGESVVDGSSIGEDATPAIDPVAGAFQTLGISWTGLALLVLVALVVVLLVVRSRRRRATTAPSVESPAAAGSHVVD